MSDAHLDRLLAELDERVRGDIAAVDAETESRIGELRAEQNARLDADRKTALAACERQAARDEASAVAAMKRERRSALLTAQHALVDRVLARVARQLAECFEHSAGHSGIARRAGALREFACSSDVTIDVTSGGISLVADGGHLRIHDTVDAWLVAERPRLSIEICRMMESTTCPSR